jgi:DNA primase
MFTEATLENIRNQTDIVDLIGEYVKLKKAGQGYLGLCPFHGEKTPSFHVHPLKQCFHCFGCHKGGNIFTFICAVEGLSFPEAVEKLGKRSGVALETTSPRRERYVRPETSEDKRLLEALEWAAKYFNYLLTESKEGKFAADYLKKRGLTEKSIKKFRIGVSPKGWHTLMELMLKRKFTFHELQQAGLIVPKDQPGQGYDRFRDRLMFPIVDKEGRTIAFGARQLIDDPKQPKYINSNESPLFSKRKNLYGLYENQRGIRLREEAILVEGYMDVVGLYEAGVDNAIATMGTALTEEHCGQLRGITQRVVTVFDPDAAGTEASKRSIHLFLGAGIFAKDLTLPEGMDPDEYVLEHNAEEFYELCKNAPRQVTKLIKEIASRGALSEQESAKVLDELTPVLRASRRLPDRVLLWDSISLVLNVPPSMLRELAEAGKQPAATGQSQGAPFHGSKKPPTRGHKGIHPVDLEFFSAALRNSKAFRLTPPAEWKGGLHSAAVEKWLETLAQSQSDEEFQMKLTALIQSEMDPELVAAASAAAINAPQQEGDKAPDYPLLLLRVVNVRKEREIQALSTQVKLNQRLGNHDENVILLERLKELRSSC